MHLCVCSRFVVLFQKTHRTPHVPDMIQSWSSIACLHFMSRPECFETGSRDIWRSERSDECIDEHKYTSTYISRYLILASFGDFYLPSEVSHVRFLSQSWHETCFVLIPSAPAGFALKLRSVSRKVCIKHTCLCRWFVFEGGRVHRPVKHIQSLKMHIKFGRTRIRVHGVCVACVCVCVCLVSRHTEWKRPIYVDIYQSKWWPGQDHYEGYLTTFLIEARPEPDVQTCMHVKLIIPHTHTHTHTHTHARTHTHIHTRMITHRKL